MADELQVGVEVCAVIDGELLKLLIISLSGRVECLKLSAYEKWVTYVIFVVRKVFHLSRDVWCGR